MATAFADDFIGDAGQRAEAIGPEQSILDAQREASEKGVRSTPTIYINDEVVSNPTWENVVAAIEKALGNPAPAAAGETPAAPGAVPPATPPQ